MARKLGYKPTPHSDGIRVGCKVSWLYYKDEATAREAGRIAAYNAEIDAAQGYDFGYQCPGSVVLMTAGEHKGLWEVCTS